MRGAHPLGTILGLLLLTACGGGGSSSTSSLLLKGTFIGGTHTLNAKPAPGWPGATAALDPAEVAQVIGFFADGSWGTAVVVNGVLEAEVPTNRPVGVVFAGAMGNFLGYLRLPGGFDSLPLSEATMGLTEIILGVLSSNAGVVTPSIDPLSGQLGLTAAQRTVLGSADDAFSSIVRNPDADGNGVIDVLEGEFWRIGLMIGVLGGDFRGG